MDKDKFGKFVAKLRKEKNMTQKDLALTLHLTDKAVSKWERGLSFPDISILEPLAETLDVSVMELLRGERFPEQDSITAEDAKQLISDSIAISDAEIVRKHLRSKYILLFFIVCLMLLISIILNIISFTAAPEEVRGFNQGQNSPGLTSPEYLYPENLYPDNPDADRQRADDLWMEETLGEGRE